MEIWKDIKGFEGIYQISSFGNIKSLKFCKEKILKKIKDSKGYYQVRLCKDKKVYTKKVHQLVAISFLNHNPNKHILIVNHKDFNALNNHLDNLEIITQRENTNRKHIKHSSKYTGVSWIKCRKKWMASIRIKGKSKCLGLFTCEYKAYLEYEKALKSTFI